MVKDLIDNATIVWSESVAWAVPEYKPEEVNAAGKALARIEFPVETDDGLDALAIINNWRASHAYPLNTFQVTLRNKARKIEKSANVVQRTKRLESIHKKLTDKASMRMTQMQDIAGCRVVFRSMRSVNRLVDAYRASKFDHSLKGEKNYINNPKADGYRCHHIVYIYKGTKHTSEYDGLRVEIQVRTQLQHAWATAVEAVGTFTRNALKSNQGDPDWLRFFALMGSAIAAMEQTPAVPNTPATKEELIDEITSLSDKLRVRQMLRVYNATINTIGPAKDAKYFLVTLDPEELKITIRRFKALQSEEANRQYTKLEGATVEGSSTQVVLVSAENISQLQKAYPNYFLDTNAFSNLVDKVLNGDFQDPLPLPV